MGRRKKSERPYIIGMSRSDLPGQVLRSRDQVLRSGVPNDLKPDVRLFSEVHGPIEGNRTIDGYVVAEMCFTRPTPSGKWGWHLSAFPIGNRVVEPIRH